MAEAKRQESEMETTESYRGPVREISNVVRVYAPANDNGESPPTTNKAQRRAFTNENNRDKSGGLNFRPTTYRSLPSRHLASTSGNTGAVIQKGQKVVRAITATRSIIYYGFYAYALQVVFWFISLIGFLTLVTVKESFLDYLDVFGWGSSTSQGIFLASVVVIFLIGLVTLVGAMLIYQKERVDFLRGISLLVAAVCLALYTAPILNLVPWIAFWCLYVVKSQTKD